MKDESLATVEMGRASAGPTGPGTMVIRVWSEGGHDQEFRARLTFSGAGGEESSLAFAGEPEKVVDAVRKWLSPTAR